MAPKGRAEGAGCVFPWKTRRGEEMRGEVDEGAGRVERETRERSGRNRKTREGIERGMAGRDEKGCLQKRRSKKRRARREE